MNDLMHFIMFYYMMSIKVQEIKCQCRNQQAVVSFLIA